LAAHQGQELLTDRETEAGAAILSGSEGVCLTEGIEYVSQSVLRYADSRIRHFEARQAVDIRRGDPHVHRAFLGELDGVVHQVDEHLAQAIRVAAHLGRNRRIDLAVEFDALGLGAAGEYLNGLLDGVAQAEVDALQFQLARFDFGEVQDVVDDSQQRFRGPRYGLGQATLTRRQIRAAQEFRHAHDTVHGRANFVAHAREEFALRPTRVLRGVFRARGFIDGAGQFAIGIAEIHRALGHLLLEKLPIAFQTRVAMPNLAQHLIEAVDEGADLILGTALDPQAVILLHRYALHGVREIQDGRGYLLLQERRQPIRGCGRDGGGHENNEQVLRPIWIQRGKHHNHV
jgi:hypothetical protein